MNSSHPLRKESQVPTIISTGNYNYCDYLNDKVYGDFHIYLNFFSFFKTFIRTRRTGAYLYPHEIIIYPESRLRKQITRTQLAYIQHVDKIE